ncbi:MAG: head GIN domain-containing protein [Saprospiraceae bacterium]
MKLPVLTLYIALFSIGTTFGQWDNHLELSHKITTETKNITGFDKIEVGEDFEVFIKFSDKAESVKIEANENLHDYIIVKKEGNTLKIDTKSYNTGNYRSKKRGAQERLVAYVTAKNLTAIEGEEDVVFELDDKLVANTLNIKLDEDCTLRGVIEVQNLMVDLDEDSVLDIEGTAHKMELEANEDSMVKNYDFVVHDLTVRLREDSEARLTVNGTVDLRASGDSQFYYKGNGKVVKQRLTGDAEMKHWN